MERNEIENIIKTNGGISDKHGFVWKLSPERSVIINGEEYAQVERIDLDLDDDQGIVVFPFAKSTDIIQKRPLGFYYEDIISFSITSKLTSSSEI